MSFKVLILAKYGTLAASTRQRLTQYIPYLEEVGAEVTVKPLLPNAYLEATFAGKPWGKGDVLRAYLDRFKVLRRANEYDVVLIYAESFPYLPALFERYAAARKGLVAYDFDDAIFHQYDTHRLAPVRWLMGNKIGALLKRCDVAFCGNAYLQNYADRHCPRTELLPTVVDLDAYSVVDQPAARIGWIGSPSTWNYLKPYAPLMREVSAEFDQPALVVGSGVTPGLEDNIEFAHWSEAEEVNLIRQSGVGIMPLDDAPWAQGKCGYKLIQYMACGLPVVASPVGVNAQIVEHGVNGFLASTQEEWRDALMTLMRDADLRKRMGTQGRKKVEAEYCLQITGPRMADVLSEMVAAR